MKKFIIFAIMAAVLSGLFFGCRTIQPELAKAYSDRGRNELIFDNYKGAIEDFTKAIEFNPEDTDLYVGRGLAYLKNGDNGAAKSDFDKAISLDPSMKKILKPLLSPAQTTSR